MDVDIFILLVRLSSKSLDLEFLSQLAGDLSCS